MSIPRTWSSDDPNQTREEQTDHTSSSPPTTTDSHKMATQRPTHDSRQYEEDYDHDLKVAQQHDDLPEKAPQTLAIAAPDTPRTVSARFLLSQPCSAFISDPAVAGACQSTKDADMVSISFPLPGVVHLAFVRACRRLDHRLSPTDALPATSPVLSRSRLSPSSSAS